jgi:CBS domain-containing membrane protein
LHGVIRCGQIMRTDATTIAPEATLDEARQALAVHGESLPVVDADGHVEGLLRADRLALADGTPATVATVMDGSPAWQRPTRRSTNCCRSFRAGSIARRWWSMARGGSWA